MIPPAHLDEVSLEITSDPVGARIIVNNQPMGRAPLRLALKATPQGFSTEYVTIKARFVAADATHATQTVDTEITPREKIPAMIFFTPEGAQRKIQ